MNYFKYLVKKLDDIIATNDCDYILYPFGERGGLVKGILNAIYGIEEKAIIDNILCDSYKQIKELEYLKQLGGGENYKILITSDRLEIYEELREQLYAVVEKEKCIELFDVPEILKKMEKEGIAREKPVYQPKRTNSVFFLPLLLWDDLQQKVFWTDDYHEIGNLVQVFRLYNNGIIGQKISENKGCILDIGANVGNHTLFFCNELNAEKVYCFEPVKATFSILEENIKLNHLEERVILNSFGLGVKDTRGFVSHYDLNNIGATSLQQSEDGDLEIKRLDGLEIQEPVVLIKIDVEGMEPDVLMGGMDLIKRNLPYIIIESFEDNFPKTRDILCGIGYQYERLSDVDRDWLFYPA